MRLVRSSLVAGLAGAAAVLTLCLPVQAQQVYRIVGPDGRITYSDKPPQDAKAKATTGPAAGPVGGAGGGGGLPFELRQIASRYPVTLYTGNNCGPCGSGRAYLANRGIPFTEKTVVTNGDIEALQRLSNGSSLPFLTIGGQQIKGFAEVEWTSFLDAAGYPKTSQLPASYKQAAATPLVAVQPQPVSAQTGTAAPDNQATAAPSNVPPPPPPESPAGIKF